MKFNWLYLILAIIILAVITSNVGSFGKWIFALVMIGVLLKFSSKLNLEV